MRVLKISWLPVAFLVGVLGLAACGDNTTAPAPAAASTTAAVSVTLAPTTAAAGTRASGGAAPTAPLPTQSDPKVEAGRQIFAKTCAGCHLGQGTQAGRAPQLSVSQNAINPDFVRNQVRKGKAPMPAFDQSKISDADLENIIAYLKAIHTS